MPGGGLRKSDVLHGDSVPITHCSAGSPSSVFLRMLHYRSRYPSVVSASYSEFDAVRSVSIGLSFQGGKYEEGCRSEGSMAPRRTFVVFWIS